MNTQAATPNDSVALINISQQLWPPRQRTYFGSLVVRSPKDGERFLVTSVPLRPIWRQFMARELKKKRDEAKQAWENATVVMKKSKNADDFTGSKKAHDEAEKLRVEHLMAEKVSEADSDDENMPAMSAHG
jgi:hypothetical protein